MIASRKRYRSLFALSLAGGLCLAGSASAHSGTGLPGGFTSGFLHPLSGWDHLLAMVSVGLWGAFLGRPLIYALPVVFPGMMVAGALLAMFGVPLPSTETGVAASVLVLGACILFAIRPPIWVAVAIVAGFALFHGYAHGRELPSAADPVGYSLGFVLATGLLHVLGIGIGALKDRPGGEFAVRVLGYLISQAGAWFLMAAVRL